MEDQLVLLYSRDTIARRVQELAAAISADYAGRDVVLIGILRGAFVFLADLIRHLTIPVAVDFIGALSYGCRAETKGQVTITKDLQIPVTGRDVLLVEDIEDTGITLQSILDAVRARGPRSVRVCTLIDKQERRRADVQVDYVGFAVSRGFIVGYGIDYAEQYRHLPDIYRIEGVEGRAER
ncbi:MAG: hypoxanthine phosphoribosyltransferase [Candidatus Methylomirabilales bacterium]